MSKIRPPDPAEVADDASPDPLVGWRGRHPIPRLRRLDLAALGASLL